MAQISIFRQCFRMVMVAFMGFFLFTASIVAGREGPKSLPNPTLNASSPYSPYALRTTKSGKNRLNQWLKSMPQDSLSHVIWHGEKAELSFEFLNRVSQTQGWSFSAGSKGFHRGQWGWDIAQTVGVELEMGSPMHALYIPNDKWLQGSPQWALLNSGITISEVPGIKDYDIRMTQVWDQWGGSDSIVIAVIDAGFNFKHPDMQNRWFVNSAEAKGISGVDDDGNGYVDDSIGWDFVENDNDPKDGNGHGTEVSSIIVANFDNEIGIAGMLPEAKVLSIRVLDASGHGDMADIAAGIQYAVSMNVSVINFSIGGAGDSPILKAAFQAARDKGIPIVVAAGNENVNMDSISVPPFSYGFENVIAVAAINNGGQFCKFSNYGKKTIDLAAPGENVLTCGVGERLEIWKDDFESDSLRWIPSNKGDFRLTKTSPIEEKQSLEWVTTSNTSLLMNDTIDLRGKYGGSIWFQTQFTPANTNDALILEALIVGDNRWRTLAAIGGSQINQGLSFGLTNLDGTRFQVRFRTSSLTSSSSRKLKIDFVYISSLNPNLEDPESYPVVAGTSIAAPHVSAYVALLKMACRRMGVPFTKEKVWAGTVPDTACANRTLSGGRLDVAKGLGFYLQTLPNLQFVDSTQVTWKQGQKIEYQVQVSKPGGDWTFSSLTMPANGVLEANSGHLSWQNGISLAGPVMVTLLAQGETTLRRRLVFEISEIEKPVNLKTPLTLSGYSRGQLHVHRLQGRTDWILGRQPLNLEGPQFPLRP